jgi:putative DNA primase/helicase
VFLLPNPYGNIPALLRQRPNWVAWGVRDAPLKSPFNPASLLSGRPSPAKAGVPDTWGSFGAAAECVERGLARGVGYEFSGGDDIYGIDLDHVIGEDGVTPQAREIVGLLASYTEISPSGTGLHTFVFAPGAEIARHRKKDGFVEIYGEARYFTVTGSIYGGARDIAGRTAELQIVHDKFLLPEKSIGIQNPARGGIGCSVTLPEQEQFLRTGLERDKVFAELWEGKRRYGNESADDQAFMNKLAYWCSADPDAMIRAFLQSPYYAQKDDAHQKKCQRADYRPNTVKNACATIYSTAAADYERWQQTKKQKRSRAR